MGGMFTQRNSWWDSTCTTCLAWSLTSRLLNSRIRQHYFKKEAFVFRDRLCKANARPFSPSLCKGNSKGPCQNRFKQHNHTGTISWKSLYFHASQGGEKGWQGRAVGCPLFAPFPSAHSLCPDIFILHNHLSPAKCCTLHKVNLGFIECAHHPLLLLRHEPWPPRSAPQQAVETRRDSCTTPHLGLFWSFPSSSPSQGCSASLWERDGGQGGHDLMF